MVFQKTVGTGITVTAPASDVGAIQQAAGDTSGLPSRQVQLYFDLEVEVQGAVYTAEAGRLVVELDTTVRGQAIYDQENCALRIRAS